MKTGRLAFANPRADSTLFIQVDQPGYQFPVDQHVEVTVNEVTVDEFDLPRGPQALRRVPIARAQMGAAELVDVRIIADKTFVPAQVPQLDSADTRQLGIRLLQVFLGSEPGVTGLH
jgi:hypothetical protein